VVAVVAAAVAVGAASAGKPLQTAAQSRSRTRAMTIRTGPLEHLPRRALVFVIAAFICSAVHFESPSFASLNFFLFLVRRFSLCFASARERKSLADCNFVGKGEAKLPQFRLGGGTKVRRKPGVSHLQASDAQNSPLDCAHLMAAHAGAILSTS
jgi:hypothetical protein